MRVGQNYQSVTVCEGSFGRDEKKSPTKPRRLTNFPCPLGEPSILTAHIGRSLGVPFPEAKPGHARIESRTWFHHARDAHIGRVRSKTWVLCATLGRQRGIQHGSD